MNLDALTASRPWLAAGWTMLHFLWAGSLIGLAFALGRRMLRKARPELRYGAACLGLATMAVAPVVIASLLVAASRPEAPIENNATMFTLNFIEFPEVVNPTEPPRPSKDLRSAPPPLRIANRPASRIAPGRILIVAARSLPGLWLVGAPATFALLAAGLIGAERLRRRSRPLTDGEIPELCRRLAGAIGIVRPVALGVCDRLVAPLLLGIVRPLILLPTSALTGWSSDQVEMALLHELAHVRRLDNLVNLAQRTIEALLFFHPAVWWLSAWVRREREHCCDQIVIAYTGHPRPYAELLAALAMPGASPGRAAVAMAEAPIVDRIRRILNLEDHSMPVSRPGVALVAGLLVVPAVLITSWADVPDQEKAHAPAQADRAGPAKPLEPRWDALIREALEGARAIPGRESRVKALIQIAEAQVQAGDRDAASQTFAEAAAITGEIRFDESRDFFHLPFLVASARAKAGFRDEAIASLRPLLPIAETPVEGVFDEGEIETMRSNKPIFYRVLVRAQAELGDEEGVRLTLEKGRAFFRTTNFSVLRTSVSQALVSFQAMSHDLIGAFRMLDDPDLFQGPDAAHDRHQTLLGIVSEIKTGDDQAAEPILAKARQSTETNNDEVRKTWPREMHMSQNDDLRVIANAEVRLGRFAEAVKTAQAIDPHRVKPIKKFRTIPTRITETGSGLALNRTRERPPRLAPEVEAFETELYSKAGVLAHIGLAQAQADEVRARELADEVVLIAERLHDPKRKLHLLALALTLRIQSHDVAGALRLAESTHPDAWGLNYLAIAKMQLRANDKAGAQTTFDTALKRLTALLDATKAEDMSGSHRTRDIRLRHIGMLQATQGDLQKGIASIERISGSELRLDSLWRLAGSLAKSNDLDGAVAVVNRIGPQETRTRAFLSILSSVPRSAAAESQPAKAAPQ